MPCPGSQIAVLLAVGYEDSLPASSLGTQMMTELENIVTLLGKMTPLSKSLHSGKKASGELLEATRIV